MIAPVLTAILMLGPEGASPAERWVAAGRQAAARDALALLSQLPGLDRLVLAVPRSEWPAESADAGFSDRAVFARL